MTPAAIALTVITMPIVLYFVIKAFKNSTKK